MPEALVVPLGVRVDDAIARLIEVDAIDASRCLIGFPHPSASNGHRMRQWANNRKSLKLRARTWFHDHPAGTTTLRSRHPDPGRA